MLAAIVALALCLPAACAPATGGTLDCPPREAAVRPSPTRHLLVVSIDGLRPEAITRYKAPTLQRLVREGSASLSARTVAPSQTMPAHTSMLTGLTPRQHGVTWNTDWNLWIGRIDVATIFGLARCAGLRTAAVVSKAKLRYLLVEEALHAMVAPDYLWDESFTPVETANHALELMRGDRLPHLLFVHFGEPDRTGPLRGWMSPAYAGAVERVDRALARLLASADAVYGTDGYALLLTADHGGMGTEHRSPHPLNRTTPWLAWGEGIRSGNSLLEPVRVQDTAAMALYMLGVPRPEGMTGEPVRGALPESEVPHRRTRNTHPQTHDVRR